MLLLCYFPLYLLFTVIGKFKILKCCPKILKVEDRKYERKVQTA